MADAPTLRRTEIAIALLGVTVIAVLLPVAVDGLRFHLAALRAAAAGRGAVSADSVISVTVAFAMCFSLVRFAWSFGTRIRASRQLTRALRPVSRDEIGLTRYSVFDAPSLQAFTLGLLRPRIYMSEGALRTLTPDALRAVLAHEACHVQRRDPLRLSIVTAAVDAIGWFPGLRHMARHQATLAELAADAAAVAALGSSDSLSHALLTVDTGSAGRGVLPQRVDQLCGDIRWESVSRGVVGAALIVLGGLCTVGVALTVAPGHTQAFCTVFAMLLSPVLLLPAALAARRAGVLLDAP